MSQGTEDAVYNSGWSVEDELETGHVGLSVVR